MSEAKQIRVGGKLVEVPVEFPWYAHFFNMFGGMYSGYAKASTKEELQSMLSSDCGQIASFWKYILINQVGPSRFRGMKLIRGIADLYS